MGKHVGNLRYPNGFLQREFFFHQVSDKLGSTVYNCYVKIMYVLSHCLHLSQELILRPAYFIAGFIC